MEEKKKSIVKYVILFSVLIGLGPIGVLVALGIGIGFLVKHMKKNGTGPELKNLEENLSRKVLGVFTEETEEDHTFDPDRPERGYECRECGNFHYSNLGHSRKKRLEQLEVLRKAGLYTDKEYRERKALIIHETQGE